MEKETPLYALTEGTTYHDYHYNNKVLGARAMEIGKKPTQVSLFIRIVVDNNTVSVYHYRTREGDLRLYCERKERIYKDDYSYILSAGGVPNNFYISMFKGKKMDTYLERFFFNNLMTYSDELCGNIMNWVINRL